MADTDGNGTVRFHVKELLIEINAKLERIDAKLETKADRDKLHHLSNRVAALEMRGQLGDRLIQEFYTAQADIETRREEIETLRHALTAKADLTETKTLKAEIQSKADADKVEARVGALETWRNYLTGGFAALAFVVGSNVLRVWFGLDVPTP